MTLDEIKYAEGQVNVFELKLNEARAIVNQLKTEYIRERAKYNIGDLCNWIDIETKEISNTTYRIIAQHVAEDGNIQYLCITADGLQRIILEQNLVKQ